MLNKFQQRDNFRYKCLAESHISQDRAARQEQPVQDCQERTARQEQPRKDSQQNKTAGFVYCVCVCVISRGWVQGQLEEWWEPASYRWGGLQYQQHGPGMDRDSHLHPRIFILERMVNPNTIYFSCFVDNAMYFSPLQVKNKPQEGATNVHYSRDSQHGCEQENQVVNLCTIFCKKQEISKLLKGFSTGSQFIKI